MEKIRIALADDHTIVRKGIASMLDSDKDFEVVAEAPNGRELISRIAALAAPPDVCLLDVNMPEMDGYETLKALKPLYPDMRFLVLTQLEHELVIVRMLKEGASGYLLKDTEPSELKQAIRTIMKQSYYNNELVNGRIFSIVTNTKGSDFNLSKRETEFLKLCCSELTYKDIAGKMGVVDSTVAFYRQTLFEKLNVTSRTGLALYALKLGLDHHQ